MAGDVHDKGDLARFQGIEAMKGAGVEFFLEIGCGKTLTGLNKKMGIEAASAVDKVTDLEVAHAYS